MNNTLRKLPDNFHIERYGVTCRLVRECDAEFIVKLRNDKNLSKHVHESGGLESQKEWIKTYMLREKEGIDYYFIYSKDGEPFAVNRLYHIDWARHSYTSGSWICKPGTSTDITFLSSVILNEIAEALGLLICLYDVRKDNKQVINYHRKIMKAIEYGETNKDILFMSTPETRKQCKLRKLLGLPTDYTLDNIPFIEEEFDY